MSDLTERDPAFLVANRMKKFFQRVGEAPLEPDFHRLSGRVVLAVVMVRTRDHGFAFYEGVNTEVAIQTGSLCAERAAIGAARADMPNLARLEICAIGTVYAPLTREEPEPNKNPSWPCGVCMEWIKKACGKSELMRIIGFPNTKFDTVIERFLVLNQRKESVDFSTVALTRLGAVYEKLEICKICSSVFPKSETCLFCSPNRILSPPLRTKRVANQRHASLPDSQLSPLP